MNGIRSAPIQVIVHCPTTPEGQQELARRVAAVHADAARNYIKNLNCPTRQKVALTSAIERAVETH